MDCAYRFDLMKYNEEKRIGGDKRLKRVELAWQTGVENSRTCNS